MRSQTDERRLQPDHVRSRHDFPGVLMQQGRVQLDADWNELVAEIIRRRCRPARSTPSDRAVVPATHAGGFAS